MNAIYLINYINLTNQGFIICAIVAFVIACFNVISDILLLILTFFHIDKYICYLSWTPISFESGASYFFMLQRGFWFFILINVQMKETYLF